MNASRQLEIFISGEEVTEQLSAFNASMSTNLYSVARTGPSSFLATFPNGMGMQVNLTNMLSFAMVVPDAFNGWPTGQ